MSDPMVPVGDFEAMSDGTAATLLRTPGTATQAATIELIVPAVENVVATDPTVVNRAAESAAALAQDDTNLVRRDSDGVVQLLDEENVLYAEIDEAGYAVRYVNKSDGSTWLKLAANVGIPAEQLTGAVSMFDHPDYVYAIVANDEEQHLLFGITRADGSIVGRFAGGGVAARRRIGVLVLAGQSNMADRSYSNATVDPPDPRVEQFAAVTNSGYYGRIVSATGPLLHHERPYRTGATESFTAARAVTGAILARRPDLAGIVLVPAAHGGTGFKTSSVAPLPTGYTTPNTGGGSWQWDKTDESVNLGRRMIDQAKAAVAAVSARGDTPVLLGVLWHQGEADAGLTDAEYATLFDSLRTQTNTELGVPTLPWVLGQQVPEGMDVAPARKAIDLAHVKTPARLPYTAFARATRNAYNPGDTTHFARSGQLHLAAGYVDGLLELAPLNATSTPVEMPVNVTATRIGDVVTATWKHPRCRVTAFVARWRIDGGAWQTTGITSAAPNDLTATIAVTAGTVEVGVASSNETATSAYSTATAVTIP